MDLGMSLNCLHLLPPGVGPIASQVLDLGMSLNCLGLLVPCVGPTVNEVLGLGTVLMYLLVAALGSEWCQADKCCQLRVVGRRTPDWSAVAVGLSGHRSCMLALVIVQPCVTLSQAQ